MDLIFGSITLDKVITYNAAKISRRSRKEYNANGGLLIDLVCRKYRLTVYLAGMTGAEMEAMYSQTGGIFFPVTFTSPSEGRLTRDFYLAEEPAAIDFISNGTAYYDTLKLVLEER